MGVTVGDSGLCCTSVTYFERYLCVDSADSNPAIFSFRAAIFRLPKFAFYCLLNYVANCL